MEYNNLAVVGATGAVGREMQKIIEERDFPFENLKLIATEKSAGKIFNINGKEYKVEKFKPGVFKDVDIALFSIGSGASKKLVPQAVKEGAVVIDNSNAFRMDKNVPLIVPEINPEEIDNHNGIIANPNCSTIQMVMVLKPIYNLAGIKRIVVSTYQAVSGTGKAAIDELDQQVRDYVDNDELKSDIYPHQIAFNILPHIDVFFEDGYTREEMKMVKETRKILADDNLAITATAARVPVFYGHSEAVNIEVEKDISIAQLKEAIRKTEGVKIIEKYPVTIMTEHDDNVLVGRIRRDNSIDCGFNLWVVANNLRKGAALNAVQIAEKLIK